jgi:hypothetical protein
MALRHQEAACANVKVVFFLYFFSVVIVVDHKVLLRTILSCCPKKRKFFVHLGLDRLFSLVLFSLNNHRYRSLIEARHTEYVSAETNKAKDKIAREIVSHIHEIGGKISKTSRG